ncbi:hypothetical protein ACN28S_59270 [Cystobacter fuscus]
MSLFDKARGAGFQAASVREYAALVELLTTPEDGARLAAVVRHFAPRFEAWWRREALPAGKPYARRVGTLLREPRIAERITQFTRFYGSRLEEENTLELVLLYRPKLVPEGTGESSSSAAPWWSSWRKNGPRSVWMSCSTNSAIICTRAGRARPSGSSRRGSWHSWTAAVGPPRSPRTTCWTRRSRRRWETASSGGRCFRRSASRSS